MNQSKLVTFQRPWTLIEDVHKKLQRGEDLRNEKSEGVVAIELESVKGSY